MPTIHTAKTFDLKHDTAREDACIDERVARVPLFHYELPNPAGTSVAKHEPVYVLPLLLRLWKPRFESNPSLKPVRRKVDDYLPQWRAITDLDEERARLAEAYGTDRTGVAWVDLLYPGERLWDEIKRVGQFVTRRSTAHHSVFLEDTAQPIPADTSSFDLLSTDQLVVSDVDPEGEIVETPESEADAAKVKAAREARLAASAERQKRLAERMAKDAARADRQAQSRDKVMLAHAVPDVDTSDDGKGEDIAPEAGDSDPE